MIKESAMDFGTFGIDDLNMLRAKSIEGDSGKRHSCSASAWAVFFYLRLNCDTTTGIIHHIPYKDIAEDLDMALAMVYNAVGQLQASGLFDASKETSVVSGRLANARKPNLQGKAKTRKKKRRQEYLDKIDEDLTKRGW